MRSRRRPKRFTSGTGSPGCRWKRRPMHSIWPSLSSWRRRNHDPLPIGAILARPSQLREIDLLVDIQCAVHRGQRIFEAGRAVEEHGALVAADAAVGEALLICRVGGGTFP